MPQYSLLGGLADPAYMSGVTTQGQPYIDPITGRLVTGTGDLYTGERPLETPPILGGEEYQPAEIPRQLTREDIADRYNAYSKPDYSPGRIASLILTSPLRLLSGIDQELKGALGIPTVEDTAEYGRTRYGGGEPTGLGERFLGALTGESQREAAATRATSHDALQNLALRKSALETNRKLQQLFGGAYDLYGKPTTLEKGERDLLKEKLFGLPNAANEARMKDIDRRIKELYGLSDADIANRRARIGLGVEQEFAYPQAKQTLNLGVQQGELNEQRFDLNDIKRRIDSIALRMKLREEGAELQLDELVNNPDPRIAQAARGFLGSMDFLLKGTPLLPAAAQKLRDITQQGATTQATVLGNQEKAATMPSAVSGLPPGEESARKDKAALEELTRAFNELKNRLDEAERGRQETRAGHDDISAAFEKYMPTPEQVTGDKNARFWDALHAVAPEKVKPSVGAQRTDMLTRKDDVLALYNAHRITKEQAIELANPARSIADVLPDYETALAEIRAGKPAAQANSIITAPTPEATPTIDPIDRVVTEDRPKATPRERDIWAQPPEEEQQRDAMENQGLINSYQAYWSRMEGPGAKMAGPKYEKGLKRWIAKGGKL